MHPKMFLTSDLLWEYHIEAGAMELNDFNTLVCRFDKMEYSFSSLLEYILVLIIDRYCHIYISIYFIFIIISQVDFSTVYFHFL